MTGGTAGTARPGPFDVDQDPALDALRLAWGDVYDTGFADGAYRAARIDGTGDLLTGQMPDELNAAIRADWNAAFAVSGPARQDATAPPVLDGPAELERLGQIRAQHPDVLVGGSGFGTWQAIIPEENGETVITRYTLRELLDKLGEILVDR